MSEGYAGDVTPRKAWEMVRDTEAVLVDVRTEAEWRFVGVPDLTEVGGRAGFVEWVDVAGQRNPDFLSAVSELAQGRPVVFLCRSGQRSASAARLLTEAGGPPAYNVLDGFEGGLDSAGHRGSAGWRADGLPWTQQ